MSQRPGPGNTLSFDFTPKPEPKPEAKPEREIAPRPEPKVYSVGELGRLFGGVFEKSFPEAIWVEGEVTGARAAPSGHVYFALKDEADEATLDVVVYRSSLTPRGRSLVKDGARLRVRARPMFWAPRGRLQLVGERIEPTGKGALLEALEKLKEKLAAEGLFATERKRRLPVEPRVIGVVTSASGAAIHDICRVAFRRGGARILLASAQVQGAGAAESIRRALAALQEIEQVDVVIVGRGGGSQDDLVAFNDEALVRDVAACRVPVVSAVGHEIDVSLMCFAADARAATPSQAAELVVPDAVARRRLLVERSHRLLRAMQGRITHERVVAEKLQRAFGDPRLLIASAQQRIDERVARMTRVMSLRLGKDAEQQQRLAQRLAAAHPRARITRDEATLRALSTRLAELARARVGADQSTLATMAGRLSAMSPLAVLARGYAIATRGDRAIRSVSEVAPGERIVVRVADGTFEADVKGGDS